MLKGNSNQNLKEKLISCFFSHHDEKTWEQIQNIQMIY